MRIIDVRMKGGLEYRRIVRYGPGRKSVGSLNLAGSAEVSQNVAVRTGRICRQHRR